MNSFTIKEKTWQVPGSYQDLSTNQLLRIIEIRMKFGDSIFAKVQTLKVLLEFNWLQFFWFTNFTLRPKVKAEASKTAKENRIERIKIYAEARDQIIYDLTRLCDFIFSNEKQAEFIANPFHKIKIDGQTLIGPSDSLGNMVFIEFIRTENDLHRYVTTGDPQHLDLLLSRIYRAYPKKRTAYSDEIAEEMLPLIQKIDPAVKQSLFIWFNACRTQMMNVPKFAGIFKRPDAEEKNKVRPHNPLYWSEVLLDMSGGKFGTDKQTEQVKVWTILTEFSRIIKRNEELERKAKGK